MRSPPLLGLLFLTLFGIGACRKSAPSSPVPGEGNIPVSKLLTSSEIESVIGEPLQQATDSHRSEAGFSVSQCYFAVSTPAKSIVVTLTSRGSGPDAREPREFWVEKFHGEAKEEEEDEHKPAPPQKMEGVGDEAYWLGSGPTGALYVLNANRFVRVAVGGADEDAVRSSKCKALAQMLLKRL
jgi:hypothetical protein